MQHNPRTVLRQVPNFLLARFFSPYASFAGFDWSRIRENRIEPVYERWQQVPDPERHQIGNRLRQVQALATPVGTATLIAAAQDAGVDIVPEIRTMKNAYN
ncbi:MAG: hypothetical protein KJZ78_25520, partial [Bryobacteraceae bacterium]|nr:hypothetical protein [Bryobacteraceae bacterium]